MFEVSAREQSIPFLHSILTVNSGKGGDVSLFYPSLYRTSNLNHNRINPELISVYSGIHSVISTTDNLWWEYMNHCFLVQMEWECSAQRTDLPTKGCDHKQLTCNQ